jgi:hypothetical protein
MESVKRASRGIASRATEESDNMIQMLTDFPDNVVAASASGVVTKRDYQECLVPRVELALKRHPKSAATTNSDHSFPGWSPARCGRFKIGIEHLSRWERVAVVSDVDWIKHAVNAFRFLMPGEVRIFATSETAAAREWIMEASV